MAKGTKSTETKCIRENSGNDEWRFNRRSGQVRRADARPLRVAEALDAYMRFRAAHEGVGYQLSAEFFADVIELGVIKCFGVTFQNDQLLADEQQPELFRRWQTRH